MALTDQPRSFRSIRVVAHSPGPLQALAFDHPNRFSYPLVMIPTFAVPLSLILHGLSLRQIARREARADRVGTLSQIPAPQVAFSSISD